MTPATFLTAFAEAVANDGALILLVMLILWMGARKKWLWGWQMERLENQLTDERVKCIQEVHDMREERDQWRRIALLQGAHPNPEEPRRPQEGD